MKDLTMINRLQKAEELLKKAVKRLDLNADKLFKDYHISDIHYNAKLIIEINQFLNDE